MPKEKQFELLLQVLKEFDKVGILNQLMLIGSWCLQFYRFHFEAPETLPAFRTMDVDFLIPKPNQIQNEIDVPSILKNKGFVPTFNRSSGIVKYDHPELRLEFLVPEIGRGLSGPQEIRKLHIKAQGLRYLNFLTTYPRLISYEKLSICVPEPAVFALHKLIISARRLNQTKQKSDLETAVGLLDFLYARPNEVGRIKSILKTLPKKWVKTILSVSEKHFPRLNETAAEL